MNSIINHMGKYDHRQHVLSDWLTELEQRFQLWDVDTDKGKITWCQLLIGATGSSILGGLEDDASWEVAKETLLSRLGVGSVRDEAWAALKELKRGSKEIVELADESEKLVKRCLLPQGSWYLRSPFLWCLDGVGGLYTWSSAQVLPQAPIGVSSLSAASPLLSVPHPAVPSSSLPAFQPQSVSGFSPMTLLSCLRLP